MIKVLFVCLGNICRSPTAEGVFRQLVQQRGYAEMIAIDSAGTHAYHIGEPPDQRAQAAAANRGIDLSRLRGRQAVAADAIEYDYILAMDQENYHQLLQICSQQQHHKIRLLMAFADERPEDEVPDPYFGGHSGFDRVLDMIEAAADGLLNTIRREHDLGDPDPG